LNQWLQDLGHNLYDPHQVEGKVVPLLDGLWLLQSGMKFRAEGLLPLSSPSQCDRFTPHWTRPQQYPAKIFLIRYKRMKDYTALWMPERITQDCHSECGERQLMEEGLDRHLLGPREVYRERVWKWKEVCPAGRSSAS